MATSLSTPQFAICIENTQYPASLEVHKVYRVLRDDGARRDGDLRVIDESGEEYLFPAEMFLLVEFPQSIQRTLQKSFARA